MPDPSTGKLLGEAPPKSKLDKKKKKRRCRGELGVTQVSLFLVLFVAFQWRTRLETQTQQ